MFASMRFQAGDTIAIYAGRKVLAKNLSLITRRRGYVVHGPRGYVDTFDEQGRLQLLNGDIICTHLHCDEDWRLLPALGVAWVGTGSLARFANDSRTPTAKIKGMQLVAKFAIQAGAEITVNYGRAYWSRSR